MSYPMSVPDRADLSDEALLRIARAELTRESARSAASTLLARYQERVYLWCYRYVRDHDRALDLAQEVLLKAFRGLESFRSDAKFSSWVFAITRNACLNAVRPVSLVRDEDVDPDALVDRDDRPDDRIESVESLTRLWALVDEVLDDVERMALHLRVEERLPVDEITRLLDIRSRSGARGVLQNARRKLKAALARQRRDDREDERDGP
jgi:RNA polymerase sigma-70 factor (ECF subfamily)